MVLPFEVKLELRKEVNKMADKKKKKLNIKEAIDESGLRFSGDYHADQDRISGTGRAGLNFAGDNYYINPYVEASGYKGKKGKPQARINRYGIKGEIRPAKNLIFTAEASTDPKGEDKKATLEATYSHNWFGGKKGGLVKKKKRSMKEGGMIIKDRQYLKGK